MVLRPPARDVFVAAGFATWGVAEVAVGAVSGPRLLDVIVAVATAAPLAWRRAAPTLLVLCSAAVAVKTGAGVNMDGLALLSAVFVASYSAGRHLPRRHSWPVVCTMVGLIWAVLWRVPDTGIYDWVFAAIWIGGPGIAGAVFRGQLARAERLGQRAARAEIEREEHARAAVRSERDRIAREMHDTVAHAVSVMVLQTGAVRSRLPQELAAERDALDRCEETGRHAIADLRRLLGLLRDDVDGSGQTAEIAPVPTIARLDDLASESRALGLDVVLEVAGDLPALDPSIEVSAYRIVQEALTNVRKHAGASRATVVVGHADGEVHIQVSDDGPGQGGSKGSAAPASGYGLLGIRERVELYGGRLSTRRTSDGYVLDAALPTGAT